jgi:hypothetical protein
MVNIVSVNDVLAADSLVPLNIYLSEENSGEEK